MTCAVMLGVAMLPGGDQLLPLSPRLPPPRLMLGPWLALFVDWKWPGMVGIPAGVNDCANGHCRRPPDFTVASPVVLPVFRSTCPDPCASMLVSKWTCIQIGRRSWGGR